MSFSVLMWFKKIPFAFTRAGCFSIKFRNLVSNSNETDISFKTSILPDLVSKYGNERMIKKVFKGRPELEQSDLSLWKCFTSSMFSFGFNFKDILKIISLSPDVLSLTEDNLLPVLKKWQLCTRMNNDNLKILITNQPDFLDLKPEEIEARATYLREYATSEDLLLTLLLLCPNVMFEEWSEILKKINFLNYEMMVYRQEILECKALSKSYEHIKMRFLITERCGFYIRPPGNPHKHTKIEIIKLNNPKLKHITDRSDISFAKQVVKITLEEYKVFSEMFAFEQNQLSDPDDSDEECD